MTTILLRLPLSDLTRHVEAPNHEVIAIRPRQIAVWVSLVPPEVIVLPRKTPAFPAVLDTGFNDSFLIQQQHVEKGASLEPFALRQTDVMQVYRMSAPIVACNVWLLATEPGT